MQFSLSSLLLAVVAVALPATIHRSQMSFAWRCLTCGGAVGLLAAVSAASERVSVRACAVRGAEWAACAGMLLALLAVHTAYMRLRGLDQFVIREWIASFANDVTIATAASAATGAVTAACVASLLRIRRGGG